MRSLRIIFLAALSAVCINSVAWAQGGLAVVRGVVQDASKAIIPGARIQLTNNETNIGREAVSAADGSYYFGAIPPGKYEVTVEANGFNKWSSKVAVEVGETVDIEVSLEVGSLANTIEVSGIAPTITTEGMQVADVKDDLRIHQLPLNQRNVSGLFTLTPGVDATSGGGFRVNGAKVGALEIAQDGATLVDRFSGNIQRVQPGLDTVQEFRIETAGSNARYSHPATVTLVTKSGTNDLHGALFETLRNNGGGLRARQRQDGNTPAFLNRNEFGASAGGPVFLPKVYNGKNKSFWFFAYEGLRSRSKVFDQDYTPTAAMWGGDFSSAINNNGVRTHIYDPLSTNPQGVRTPFSGDIIPQNRMGKLPGILKNLAHAATNDTNPFLDFNVFAFYPNKTNNDTYTVKVDQRFSLKDSLSGRFTRSRNTSFQPGGRFGSPNPDITNGYGTGRGDNRVYGFAGTETHTFSPTLLNEFRVVVNRNPNGQGTLADFTDWPSILQTPNPFGALGWPTISFGNDPWSGSFDADNHKDQNLTSYQIENNSTWIRGKHSIQFGGNLRRENNNIRELQQAQGSHDFGADWTSLYDPASNNAVSFTGIGLASAELGLPTFLSDQYNRGFFYFQQWNAGLYLQDSWRPTRKLTIDAGVRWEKWTPYLLG
jgi:hypothetical protein